MAVLLLQGCAVVKLRPDGSVSHRISQNQSSILTRSSLSVTANNMLEMVDEDQTRCLADLERCKKRLGLLEDRSDDNYLSTLSELYLARARELALSNQCADRLPADFLRTLSRENKAGSNQPLLLSAADCLPVIQANLLESARYAYAYLFYGSTPWPARAFEDRRIQVRDFYNVAVSRLVQLLYQSAGTTGNYADFGIGPDRIVLDNKTTILTPENLPKNLYPTLLLDFEGMKVHHQREGFGVGFVAVLPDRLSGKTEGENGKIVQSQYLPLTLVLRFPGNTLQQVLASRKSSLEVYNPLDSENFSAPGNLKIPLAADFTAPYGLWLAQTPMAEMALTSLVRTQSMFNPTLYMIAPYDPNKRVILMIHGLASSPEAWISLTNDILGDPVLRKNYQVWQVFYPTRNPILETRYQIYQLVRQAFKAVDPQGTDKASSQAILIGHSMGGLISRMLISETDLAKNAPKGTINTTPQMLEKYPGLRERYRLHALPNISRAVFIATPFQGTPFTELWFTRAARKVIGTPVVIIRATQQTLTGHKNAPGTDLKLQEDSGPSELAVNSRFMRLTRNMQIVPHVRYNTIIGATKQGLPLPDTTDGIVPYSSSHLEGAESEKVIFGNHSVQETPEAVLELRRILKLHLRSGKASQ